MCENGGDRLPGRSTETSSTARICFLPSWPRTVTPREHTRLLMFAMGFAACCVVAVVGGLFWVVESLLIWKGAPLRPLPIIVLAALAVLVWYAIRGVQSKRLRAQTKEEDVDPADARFMCIATPPSRRPDGALPDVPFEPRVFRAFLAATPPVKAWGLGVLVGMILSAGVYAGIVPKETRFLGPLVLWAIMFTGIATGEFLWPTYFRVTPGQLEAIRYSMLSDRPVSVVKFSLRDARIIYNWPKQALHLYVDEWKDYWVMFMPDRRQFIRALFLAAASTHRSPPVPDDALLG